MTDQDKILEKILNRHKGVRLNHGMSHQTSQMSIERKVMKLSPVEILGHLGFDVPADGVEISSNAYYMITALRLAGQTIDLDRLPERELAGMDAVLVGAVLRSYFNFRRPIERGAGGPGDHG